MTLKKGLTALLFYVFFVNASSGGEVIEFVGQDFVVTTPNLLQLSATTDSKIWAQEQSFTKLRFMEVDRSPEEYRKLLHEQLNSSPTAKILETYKGISANKHLIIVKELISQTPFLRSIYVNGEGAESFHLELSHPLPADEVQLNEFIEMLEALKWQPNYRITLEAGASVSVSKIPGFVITNQFKNGLFLRSDKQLAPIADAMLVINLIEQPVKTFDIEKATLDVLHSATSLKDIKIQRVKTGSTGGTSSFILNATAEMVVDGTPVDIVNVSLKVANALLLAQVVTVAKTESLLKMEDIARQALSHARVIKKP